jgi:1-acyl-sn-glycerol-3-phosphate acyltransferase
LTLPAAWLVVTLTPPRWLASASRATCSAALRLAGCRLRAEGLAHVERGAAVLACNHVSYADGPALVALLPGSPAFVAKHEVLRWPVIGAFMRRGRHVAVDREDAAQGLSGLSAITEVLRHGRPVVLFPEGTFTRTAGLRAFRLGAFQAAVDAGVPVVPMAIRGTRRLLRDGEPLPRPAALELWIGAPIAPSGEGWRAVVDLRDRVREAIAAHCGEPRLDALPAGPERDA